ncbi:MAG TPA: NAD(P)/FAD-dependent oxidoreductase [Candidatus Cryosericum sp.]|nr:NAD(P)/FAD-dependent oxidoreductase [Candidatus Cryosericum sp.]
MRSVAIIGGGPGGAHCGRALAETGFEVTLFEPRDRFEKACGGGIPARGIEAYPFLNSPRLPVRIVRTCVVVAPSGREAVIPLSEPLHVFSRADLHLYLLERAELAGVRRVRSRVVDFTRRPEGAWTLLTEPGPAGLPEHGPFDYLVAADGASGVSRRRLAGSIPARQLTQGIGYYLPGLSEDAITLKFFSGLNGYLWVFPRTDHSSAGICGTLGEMPVAELRALMDDFLRLRYGPEIVARSERYAALIPGAPSDPEGVPLIGDAWAFVGDTGRSVDPLTREGIYFAMLAGDLLAEALRERRAKSYPLAWTSGPGREFAWAARHAAGFFDPRFIERLVALCSRSPTAARVLSDLIGGRQPYRTLKLRLLLSAPAVGWQVIQNRRPAPVPLTPARGS